MLISQVLIAILYDSLTAFPIQQVNNFK